MFYVYFLCDPREKASPEIASSFGLEFEPFYVGKGTGKRTQYHLREAIKGKDDENPHKYRIIRKILADGLEPMIVYHSVDIKEEIAFELEKSFINLIGTSNNNTGPLTNLSEGGEGNSGYRWSAEQKEKLVGNRTGAKNPFYGKKHDDKTKKLMSEAAKNRCGENNSFYGKHHNEISKKKISAANKGNVIGEFSEDHKNKIACALRGKKKNITDEQKTIANTKRAENAKKYGSTHHRQYIAVAPDGTEYRFTNIKQWCKEMNLNYRMICYLAQGKFNNYNGYTCNRINTTCDTEKS